MSFLLCHRGAACCTSAVGVNISLKKLTIRASCPCSLEIRSSRVPFSIPWLARVAAGFARASSMSRDCLRKKCHSIPEGRGFSFVLCVKGSVVYVPTRGCVLHNSERVRSHFFGLGCAFLAAWSSKTDPLEKSVGLFLRNKDPKSAAFCPRILFVFPPS